MKPDLWQIIEWFEWLSLQTEFQRVKEANKE